MLVLSPLRYLAAWDPARNGIRHFRMDRITEPSVVEGATFRRRRVQFEDGALSSQGRPVARSFQSGLP